MHLHHITINTGHSHRSTAAEIDPKVLSLMQPYLQDMLAGKQRAMTQSGNTSCRIGRHTGKMIEFVVAVGNERQTDALRFVVCRHSRAKAEAWALAGGSCNPPQTPFLAVNRLMPELQMLEHGATLPDIMMLADFERCIAWAWLQSQTD